MDLIEYHSGLRKRHPWEISRARFFKQILKNILQDKNNISVLDVGSGDAYFASQISNLLPSSQITCWDHGYTPELIAELQPQDKPVTLSQHRPQQKFDLLMLMDVLEHVERDHDFISNLVSDHLKPSGLFLVSVPAWPELFSEHDKLLNHHRRYRPSKIHKLIQYAGLEVLNSGQLFRSLYLIRKLEVVRAEKREQTRLEDWDHSALLTFIVSSVLNLDGMIFKTLESLGVKSRGLSWWALCQKLP